MNLYETQPRLQTVKFEFTESRRTYQAEAALCRQEGKQNNKSLSNSKLLNYFQLWTPVAL